MRRELERDRIKKEFLTRELYFFVSFFCDSFLFHVKHCACNFGSLDFESVSRETVLLF